MARSRETVRVDGLQELLAAFDELSTSVRNNAAKRGLMRAAQPIAERAKELVPVRSGELRDSIKITGRIANNAGRGEFAKVLTAGGTRDEAAAAAATARRGSSGSKSPEVQIGSNLRYAKLVEFGSVKSAAQPYLRPAFDQEKGRAIAAISGEIGLELEKAATRARRRAAKRAAKGA